MLLGSHFCPWNNYRRLLLDSTPFQLIRGRAQSKDKKSMRSYMRSLWGKARRERLGFELPAGEGTHALGIDMLNTEASKGVSCKVEKKEKYTEKYAKTEKNCESTRWRGRWRERAKKGHLQGMRRSRFLPDTLHIYFPAGSITL